MQGVLTVNGVTITLCTLSQIKFAPIFLLVRTDNEGDCAVLLALRHNGLDADFEHTIKALDAMRYMHKSAVADQYSIV